MAHKIAPALRLEIMSIVLKPAAQTPLVALMLADVVARSGYPKEAVGVLPMPAETAAPLIEDPRFKLFTFTGSAAAGWALKARAGKKRVALELGGNSGMHRSLRRRCGPRGGALCQRRLCLRRTKLHQRAANLRGAQHLRNIHRETGCGGAEAQAGRSLRGSGLTWAR